MHARLSRFAGLPPERIDQTIRGFEQGELPDLEQQPGYQGVLVLVDHKGGKAAAISFWDSEDNLRKSERVAAQARDTAVATAQPSREPIVDRYEVVLRKP
jgi:heme-degrading monooxygenase HmoA